MSDLAVKEYVERVRATLGNADGAADVLAELQAHIRDECQRRGGSDSATSAVLSELGSPEAYATAMRDAARGSTTADDDDQTLPQGKILGMPYDLRGANTERIMRRLWNPADPRVFMPRMFGVGWTINFGALAVKLGAGRPDDFGDEAFAHAPEWSVRAALGMPVVFAASILALVAVTWRTLPLMVPTHWGPSGVPDGWSSKPIALGLLLTVGVIPVVVGMFLAVRAEGSVRKRLAIAAVLTAVTTLALGITIVTVHDASGVSSSGNLIIAAIGVMLLLSFLVFYIPARLGVAAEWRQSLDSAADDGQYNGGGKQ